MWIQTTASVIATKHIRRHSCPGLDARPSRPCYPHSVFPFLLGVYKQHQALLPYGLERPNRIHNAVLEGSVFEAQDVDAPLVVDLEHAAFGQI